MMLSLLDLTYIVLVVMIPGIKSNTQNCKWSNDDCSTDAECCSESCTKLHDGTMPRCRSSPLKKPCFFNYQCEDGLSCGEFYLCCSPFWGVCSKKVDCCDTGHECREEDGFTYKRCLPPSKSDKIVLSKYLLILMTYHVILCAFYQTSYVFYMR